MKKILLCALTLALAGCAVTREGVRVSGGPGGQANVDKLRGQLVKNTQSTVAKKTVEGVLATDVRAGIIMVGVVGPLRTLDAKQLSKGYETYAKTAEQWHPGKAPTMSEPDFMSQIGGWSTVETFSIPGVMKTAQQVLVRNSNMATIGYPSTVGSFVAGSTGDLVAAQSNEDGVLIIDKVLCKDASPDYRVCARQFSKGRFDLTSGEELGRDMKPKDGGIRIDPATYQLMQARAN